MKKQFVTIAVCILAAACSKAELYENTTTPQGETVTLTIPQTKVAIDGETYAFEDEDEITAVASNGSTAVLKAQGTDGTFAGTFSVPVADGSKISLYYNQTAVNQDGTAAFAQNGKPWLVSTGNSFTRTADRQISLSATLSTPEGVCAIAFVTDGTDIESIEFHPKKEIALESFNGSGFTGGTTVSEAVLEHGTANVKYKKSSIFHVPAGMEGGYWIKAVQGGQSMYKSYSSDKAVTGNTGHIISGFTPASVNLDVQISGFPTSYSWYVANEEGSGVTSKDVAKANATANDWIGAGKATYTITREGIPSTLLKFESFKLTVDGKEYTGTESEKAIAVEATTGHSSWGQKDIVATVTYRNLATGAEETASKTITRHITGLPWKLNPPKKTDFPTKTGHVSYNSSYIQIGGVGSTAVNENSITSKGLHIPQGIDVSISTVTFIHGEKFGINYATDFIVGIGGNSVISQNSGTTEKDYTLNGTGTLSSSNNTAKCYITSRSIRCHAKVKNFNILYR